MNMVWFAILALVAGLDGRSAREHREVGRPADGLVAHVGEPAPSRSLSAPRHVDPRPRSSPWSTPILGEYDTEEQDESWVVQLDVLASVPIAWLTWDLPGRSAVDGPIEGRDPLPPRLFPLRC